MYTLNFFGICGSNPITTNCFESLTRQRVGASTLMLPEHILFVKYRRKKR